MNAVKINIEELQKSYFDEENQRVFPVTSVGELAVELNSIIKNSSADITRDKFVEIINLKYDDIFFKDGDELTQTNIGTFTIELNDNTPIKQPIRRVPYHLKAKFKEQLDLMIKSKFVVPSVSPWSSPVVLVNKKDGSLRVCIDYRKLNDDELFQ